MPKSGPIVIVEDDLDDQEILVEIFKKLGYQNEIVYFIDGNNALQYINRTDVKPFLILSDINMPGMSGLELLKKIKQMYAVPPPVVMMITAYGDEENYNRSLSLGADDFLTKPLDFNLLKEKLKTKING